MAAGQVAAQVPPAGLLDEVNVDLVPVFLGAGRRYFTDTAAPPRLGDPTTIIASERVTHLISPARG